MMGTPTLGAPLPYPGPRETAYKNSFSLDKEKTPSSSGFSFKQP